ncbi:transposable element Tcb2 transposase [Trichonephila clavipes]|nr:transposable element Tcb2 transposase [Trichonephila clavipes]
MFCYPHCNEVFQQDNFTSHESWLAIGRLDEPSSSFSIINCSPRAPDLISIEPLWDVLELGLKGHHTAPTNFTEL